MKIKLSKSQWEIIGKKTGWMKQAQFVEKMMPGQTPYTSEEKSKLNDLVSDAAQGDPGEQNETDLDPYKALRTIEVIYDKGPSTITNINGTKKSIREYYMKNNMPTDYDYNKPDAVRRVVDIKFKD